MAADDLLDRDHELTCPWCGKVTDGLAQVTDTGRPAPPSPGDLSLCITCAGLAIFTAEGQRRATPAERAQLLRDPEVARVAAAIVLAGELEG